MAVNVFGFPIQGTAQVAPALFSSTLANGNNAKLSDDGANISFFQSDVAIGAGSPVKIQMPNPALCDGQVRTVTNGGITSTLGAAKGVIEVRQYNTVDYTGALISTIDYLATKYNSGTFYCDGTQWIFLSGSVLE
jgi:hypothetical protein